MGRRPTYDPVSLVPPPKRHSRKCQICNHPDRKAIESAFVDWKRASWIEHHYGLRGKSTIYRHARATGLDVRRHEDLSRAAERIAETVNRLQTPKASLILRAVQTLASLNERGQRIKPPATSRVVSAAAPPAFPTSSITTAARRAPRRSALEMISNRHTPEKLEIGATHSKQRSEVTSNRHT